MAGRPLQVEGHSRGAPRRDLAGTLRLARTDAFADPFRGRSASFRCQSCNDHPGFRRQKAGHRRRHAPARPRLYRRRQEGRGCGTHPPEMA